MSVVKKFQKGLDALNAALDAVNDSMREICAEAGINYDEILEKVRNGGENKKSQEIPIVNGEVLNVLQECKLNGKIIVLPPIQLERKLYESVKKVLGDIGGRWSSKDNGFIFKIDPADLFEKLKKGEWVNFKQEYQFFETPYDVACKLVELAQLKNGDYVLEPSAGQGAIIKAILATGIDVKIDAIEIAKENVDILKAEFALNDIKHCDFVSGKNAIPIYNKIIANPPFSKNQDIAHVSQMYNKLDTEGILVSVMSNHWRTSENKAENQFRNWLAGTQHKIIDLEKGTFKESGTMVACCIVVIYK